MFLRLLYALKTISGDFKCLVYTSTYLPIHLSIYHLPTNCFLTATVVFLGRGSMKHVRPPFQKLSLILSILNLTLGSKMIDFHPVFSLVCLCMDRHLSLNTDIFSCSSHTNFFV